MNNIVCIFEYICKTPKWVGKFEFFITLPALLFFVDDRWESRESPSTFFDDSAVRKIHLYLFGIIIQTWFIDASKWESDFFVIGWKQLLQKYFQFLDRQRDSQNQQKFMCLTILFSRIFHSNKMKLSLDGN